MICDPCLEGGERNNRATDAVHESRDRLLNQAAMFHGRCKGGTWCDCQHVVGRTVKAGREPK